MKSKLTIAAFLLMSFAFVPTVTHAQETQDDAQTEESHNIKRGRWMSEIRKYKHEFLAQELELTDEQQSEFFPIYDEMEDELEDINTKTREVEMKASENTEAEDHEVEAAARTIFEQKRVEGQIEMTYFEKFKEILTPRQLLQLKDAERSFMKKLMGVKKRHRNNRK